MQKVAATSIRKAMQEQSPLFVSAVMAQVKEAVEIRRKWELDRKPKLSKDFANVENLQSEEFARFALAVDINPMPYINSALFQRHEFEALSGVSWEARTRNQRAYAKMSGAASFFYHNDIRGLEDTLKAFVACAILASAEHDIIPRDLCKNFMGRIDNLVVSPELSEVIEKHRISTVFGEQDSQTSHCTLQLAQMKAGEVIRRGKEKDFRLNLQSPVTIAFAERFGMMKELKAAQDFRSLVWA